MEARVEYQGRVERPRLTVVKDGASTYSALPHSVMRDTSLSPAARLLYAILQGYAWQEGDECRASHETMASELGCSTRMLRTYLDALIDSGLVTEHDSGYRRQKVYRLVSIGTVLPIETSNEKPASDSNAVNRKFSTVQSEISDTFNRKPASDSKKKTPEKKTLEELAPTELGGASAPQPATAEPTTKKTRGTRCPETFPLEERHFAYGAGLGFDQARVEAETEKFLSHHRFKGTLGQDWYAGWQNWMRKAVEYGAARPSTNGYKPPVSDKGREITRQHSKWSDDFYTNGIGAAGRRKVGEPTDDR